MSSVDHTTIRQHLFEIVKKRSLPPVILLTGRDTSYKNFLAQEVMIEALCLENGKNVSKRVHKDIHPDVLHVYPEEKSGLHQIDRIRALLHENAYAPFETGCIRFYCIHEIEKLLPVHGNILLKALEESKSYAHFILFAETTANVLPTIVSRSVVFYCDSQHDTDRGSKDEHLHDSQKSELSVGSIGEESISQYKSSSHYQKLMEEIVTDFFQASYDDFYKKMETIPDTAAIEIIELVQSIISQRIDKKTDPFLWLCMGQTAKDAALRGLRIVRIIEYMLLSVEPYSNTQLGS